MSTETTATMSTETTPATTSTETTKMITLLSSDNETFEIEEKVAMQSQTIKCMIEDECAGSTIPLPNVTGAIFAKVIEYCKKHASPSKDNDRSDDDLMKWDAEYISDLEMKTLFELILAANFLDIKGLLDLGSQKVADLIKDYKPEEIRKLFNITNDCTPEEEKEIREENQWAFE